MRITVWKTITYFILLVRRVVRYAEMQRLRSEMKFCGKNFRIDYGSQVEHPEFITICDDVTINSHAWLSIVTLLGKKEPSLEIARGTYIGRFATISCANRIVIEEDVLISDRVFITDVYHGFQDTTLPVSSQPLYSPGPVEIGSGTWLGIGVSVMPNVKIGKHCVIGANAVVTHDIPDYHVAAGVPARIIRRID